MYFYKVVYGLENKYYSYLANYSRPLIDLSSKYVLEYKVGEWTYPKIKNSKLFMFASYQAAETYKGEFTHVFLCEAKNPTWAALMLLFTKVSDASVEKWWAGNEGAYCNKVPEHTKYADAIKILEEVYA